MIHIGRTRLAFSIIGLIIFVYGVGVLTSPWALAMDPDRWGPEARTRWLVLSMGVMAVGAVSLFVANLPRRRSGKGRPVRCPKCRHATNDRLAACPECGHELAADPLVQFSARAVSGALADGSCRECGRAVRPELVMTELVPGQTVACPRCRMGLGHG